MNLYDRQMVPWTFVCASSGSILNGVSRQNVPDRNWIATKAERLGQSECHVWQHLLLQAGMYLVCWNIIYSFNWIESVIIEVVGVLDDIGFKSDIIESICNGVRPMTAVPVFCDSTMQRRL